MYKLFYIYQRKHLNDLLRNTEELNIEPKEVMNRFMDNLIEKDNHCTPQEELDIAYKEVMRFYRKWKQD